MSRTGLAYCGHERSVTDGAGRFPLVWEASQQPSQGERPAVPRRPLLPGRHRITAIVLALLALAGVPHPACAQESADAETLRLVALRLVNKSRAEAKLPPLAIGKE